MRFTESKGCESCKLEQGIGGSGNPDTGHLPNPADGVDVSNAEHFTFNLGENSEFEVLLKDILSSNSILKGLLHYFDSGYVHMTFSVGAIEVNGVASSALAATSYPNEGAFNITFNENYVDANGWNKTMSEDNIGYDWSKVSSVEEALVVTLTHEAIHAKHQAIYDESLRIGKDYPDRATQYLLDKKYSREFVEIFYVQQEDGKWKHNDSFSIQEKKHEYMQKYDHVVIDAALEEYRKDQ